MLSYIGANLTVTSAPSTVVNPVTVAGSQFQPPANASISLVTPPVTPPPLSAFTRTAPNTTQTAAAGDNKKAAAKIRPGRRRETNAAYVTAVLGSQEGGADERTRTSTPHGAGT